MSDFFVSKAQRVTDEPNREPITLITQFFIVDQSTVKTIEDDDSNQGDSDKDEEKVYNSVELDARNKELRDTLKRNVENPLISKIILLNERKYTDEELGVSHKKIKQIKLGKRMSFKDVFNHVQGDSLKGYVIASNADIFFDGTLESIYYAGLERSKRVLCPLRYIFHNKNLKMCKLDGPRADFQDSWVFHSKFNVSKNMRKPVDITFGRPNGNLKITYLLSAMGYDIVNDPIALRTYHYHNSNVRKNDDDIVKEPYMYVVPNLNRDYGSEYYPMSLYLKKVGLTPESYTDKGKIFQNDGKIFHEQITAFMESDTRTTIFRLNKNIASILYRLLECNKLITDGEDYRLKMAQSELGQAVAKANKCNIHINSIDEIQKLSRFYFQALEESKYTLHYMPITEYFTDNAGSCKEMLTLAKKTRGSLLNQAVVSPINRYNGKFWTELISNKNIFVLTNNQESLDIQKTKLNDIWGVPTFNECKITSCNLPEHKENDEINCIEYIEKYVNFLHKKLHPIMHEFDMVLIGDTVYNGFITHYFTTMNKMVIDVGEGLDMYFGIYTDEDMNTHKDFLSLYKNKHWCKV